MAVGCMTYSKTFEGASAFSQNLCWNLHPSVTMTNIVLNTASASVTGGPQYSVNSSGQCACPSSWSFVQYGQYGKCAAPPTWAPTPYPASLPSTVPTGMLSSVPTFVPSGAPSSVRFQPADTAALYTAVNAWCDDEASALSTYGDISTWDTSLVTNMFQLFFRYRPFNCYATFNEDITDWDTSSVTNMG